MTREELRELLFQKYIAPTQRAGDNYVGVEIEMPVVNLSGGATDQDVTRRAASSFIKEFNFVPQGIDAQGNVYSATDPLTGDNLSFDCSYNNMEFSFGREERIADISDRFRKYVRCLNGILQAEDHTLTGMGISPYHTKNDNHYLPVPRYQMLEGYLLHSSDWEEKMYFHPYPDFAAYASASQVQLDVERHDLIETIRAYSLIEPVKAVLFDNAWMPEEPDILCVRDIFWANSTHGINPHNVGMYERIPANEEELLDYIERTSLFCCERDGKYLHFAPIPATEYFDLDEVEGLWYDKGKFYKVPFKPEVSDLKYLRTYKFEDLTFRGTIEYRSCCNQPFRDAMSVAAFHLGLSNWTGGLIGLMESDTSIYQHGYTAAELRTILNRREWPEFIDRKGLRRLCLSVLDLAGLGLKERGYGEEKYLEPLYERADELKSPARRMVEGLESGKSMADYVLEYAEF